MANRSGPSTETCVTLVSTFFHFSGNLSAVVEAKRFYQIARGFGLVTDLMEAQNRGFYCNSVPWLGLKHVRVLVL